MVPVRFVVERTYVKMTVDIIRSSQNLYIRSVIF